MKTFPIPSAPAPGGGEDKPKGNAYAKGGDVQACSYAQGGPVLGRSRDFMKEPSPFRSSVDGIAPANQRPIAAGGAPGEPTNSYPKEGKGEKGKDKSMSPVMPRK